MTFLPNLQLLDLSLNQESCLKISHNLLLLLQIEDLPEHGLSELSVVDLNLNENHLHYLGADLWMCQRLKVSARAMHSVCR